MIKVIIFDNNGVLVTSNEETGFPALEKIIGEKINDFIPIYNKIAEEVDEGKITTDEFFRKAVIKTGINLTPEELRTIQYGSFRRKEEVINIAKELSKEYEIAVLSNFGDGYWELNKKWQIDEFVPKNKIFVSYQMGIRKPFPEIYLKTLDKLGVKPDEAIFIDDKSEFIKGAESVGINSILFTSPKELKKQLKYILENENGK